LWADDPEIRALEVLLDPMSTDFSYGGTRPPERKVATMKGYVGQKGFRFYAVVYTGVDPMTGRERRRWYPVGTDRKEADESAARPASRCAPTQASAGLTVATFMLRRWLPAKRVSLRPTALGRLPPPGRAARGSSAVPCDWVDWQVCVVRSLESPRPSFFEELGPRRTV